MEDLFGVDPSDSRYKLKSSFNPPDAPVASTPVVPAVGRIQRLDDWCGTNGPIAPAPNQNEHSDADPSMPRRAPVMQQPVAQTLPATFGSPSKTPCPYCLKHYDMLRPHFCRESLSRLGF
jgi:hypothetical protein